MTLGVVSSASDDGAQTLCPIVRKPTGIRAIAEEGEGSRRPLRDDIAGMSLWQVKVLKEGNTGVC